MIRRPPARCRPADRRGLPATEIRDDECLPPAGGGRPLPGEPTGRWLTPGVGAIGGASLLADLGHEVPTSLLPSLLTSTLGAPASVLGIIEGVSDGLAGVARLGGGALADDPHRRRDAAVAGYAATAVLSGLIGAAGSTLQVAVLRAGAWTARGLRVPSRNALLADVFAASGAAVVVLAGCFVLAGAAIGFVETAEHAAVAALAPGEIRGSAFGVLAGAQSIGNLVASAVAGILWTAISPGAGLAFAAALMGASLLVLAVPVAHEAAVRR